MVEPYSRHAHAYVAALSNFYDRLEQQKREMAGNYWIGIQFTPRKTISKIRSYHER
jgi:hypothetical protein